MCDTDEILKSLGLAYIKDVEPASPPQFTNKIFADIVKNCNCNEFCSKKLYPHQLETFNHLSQGKSVILVSSTGSGKTEAWLSYFFSKPDIKALAIYPTKALTNDQAHRIADYARCMGFSVYEDNEVIYGDVVRYDGDTSKKLRNIKDWWNNAKVVLTNPEMIASQLKKRLKFPFNPNLIVLDEIDFYKSHNATLLIVLLKKLFPKARFVIISGTLSNPDDLKAYLGNAEVVRGKGFKAENRTYILLGYEKDLSDLYNQYKNILSSNFNVKTFEEFKKKMIEIYFELTERDPQDPLLKNLKNDIYDKFKFKNFTKYKAPIEELLKSYKNCKGELTLAFFPSISECENFGRSPNIDIPRHHSKVKKKDREEIEKGLREGKIFEVFTVKTLQQGINIGNAKRVIHVGIPITVKDFLQREGRKGRREDIDFTESIIIPLRLDSRLRNGIESLKTWREILPETIIFNDKNAYVTEWLATIEGVLKGKKDSSELNKLRFYSFEANRAIIKLIEQAGVVKDIDRVPFKDLIEYYQIGSIDFATNGIVEEISYRQEMYNIIERYVKDISNVSKECIKNAIDEYGVKVEQWGIRPNFERDVELGKVIPKVNIGFYFNGEGYVKFNELPIGVVWYIESRNKIQKGNSYDYEYTRVNLDCDVFPKKNGYQGYTYAYIYEINDPHYVDEGMAFLITALRLMYGVEVELIQYSLVSNVLKVWELNPTGLLAKMREGNFVINNQKLDFDTFKNYLDNVVVDNVFKIIFYSIFPVKGVDFDKARKKAVELAFKLFNYATIRFKNVSLTIRPNVMVIDSVVKNTGNGYTRYYGITYYDSQKSREEVKIYTDCEEFTKDVLYISHIRKLKEIINGAGPSLNESCEDLTLDEIGNEVRVLEEMKEKYGYEVTPSDFSQKIREYMNKLTDPNAEMNENEIKELFRERARIYQGLRNLLESDEKQR